MRTHINCLACVRALFAIVFVFGAILAAITVHRFAVTIFNCWMYEVGWGGAFKKVAFSYSFAQLI
jgi:hypothetical protein